MALSIGARLGSYEVISALGSGGMGEVYRARDTTLNRDVALKVLPDALRLDVDRLARFQREAQILASLNHPNIAAIYGFEGGARALVMELVEGPTLADLIGQAGMPLDRALPMARQLADALEAAHELGIIHRDLKPANIKVRPDGTLKVLDFGLAKNLDPAPATPGATISPTVDHATQAGIILGTAAYMSPEQATGRPVDKRSDLWAFGVTVFEMLTGRPLFIGETVADVLASVLKSDIDWSALPPHTPAPIRRLLRRCLERDRKRRLDSASAARLEIDDALAAPGTGRDETATPARSVVATAVSAAIVGSAVAGLVAWAFVQQAPQSARLPSRFAITPPPAQAPWLGPFDRSIAISPDGRRLVYTAALSAAQGGNLYVRSVDQLEITPLAGVTRARAPFFSPDGQWIGFFQDAELKKAPVAGGPAISICSFGGAPRGASWGDDGTVVFATGDPTTGLWRVASSGGTPTPLTTPAPGEGDHLFPMVLPGGHGVLFTVSMPGQAANAAIAVLDSRTNTNRTLLRGGSQPEYLETGHLVYATGGSLRAVPFDLTALAIRGEPVTVVQHLRMVSTGAASFSVSRSGALAYLPGGLNTEATRSLMWVDRAGHETAIDAPPRAYYIPRVSPDGAHVALDIRDQENDIWVLNLRQGGALRKLTYGPGADSNPVWTLDGKGIIFTSNRSGQARLYWQAADGTGSAMPFTTGGGVPFATSATPDGTGIIGHRDGPTTFDVVLFSLPASLHSWSSGAASPAGAAEVRELVKTPLFEHNAELSPNGRYLAYQSNESGPYEVIVRPFPQVDRGMWTISTASGTRPVWARNGKELFYRDGDGALVAMAVDTSGPTFQWASPRKLFDSRDPASVPDRNYDVSPDGRHFLMLKGSSTISSSDIVLVLDWSEELKRLVPRN